MRNKSYFYYHTAHNSQTKKIPCFAIAFLGLRENRLTGPIPTDFGNLVNLTTLNLATNQLNGNIPSSLGNLKIMGKQKNFFSYVII